MPFRHALLGKSFEFLADVDLEGNLVRAQRHKAAAQNGVAASRLSKEACLLDLFQEITALDDAVCVAKCFVALQVLSLNPQPLPWP